MDLSIVIVSWNVRDLLERCLETVQASLDYRGLTGEIIVVDNGSTDGSPEMVRDRFPSVSLVEPGVNLGYSGGNNVGLRRAQGRYVLILNPDTELMPETLGRLVDALDRNPSIGLVGPALFFPDGRLQSSRRRFPNLLVGLIESTSLEPWFAHSRILRDFRLLDYPDDQPAPVDWVVGAALMVRREVVEQVGLFDETFFMYFEELDWQRRIKEAGWSIWYWPEARVVHHEGASSRQVVARRQILFATSKVEYYRKWYGPRVAACLRVWLWLLVAWELVVESVKLLLRHKPEMRSERIRQYRQVLASSLRRV